MKLIPSEGKNTANYWCTWRNQRLFMPNAFLHMRVFDMEEHNKLQREILSDEFLFGKRGLLVGDHMKDVRKDMYVLLDDGWDIPYNGSYSEFGSLVLNEERFPYGGKTPAENLAILNQKILDLGYAGTGLWVPMSCVGETKENPFGEEAFREYWNERARWLHEAGIAYIKADWGFHKQDPVYRRIMTEAFREYAPEIQIEHTSVDGFFRVPGRNPKVKEEQYKDFFSVGDAYRCYDVRFEFNCSTTLARVHGILSFDHEMKYGCKGYINVGEEPYIAAALGCTMGVMSHPLLRGSVVSAAPTDFENGISHRETLKSEYHSFDHYVRTLRWQRLAPALPYQKGELQASEKMLEDSWTYQKEPYPYFPARVTGQTLTQRAPQVVSRGVALPKILSPYAWHSNSKEYEPFVVASKNRETGVYTIATLPRTIDRVMNVTIPRVDVAATGLSADKCFGVFGEYRTLTLEFDRSIEGMRLYGGDILLDDQPDITEEEGVHIEANKLTLDGALLSRIGLECAALHDFAEPGSVFKLV